MEAVGRTSPWGHARPSHSPSGSPTQGWPPSTFVPQVSTSTKRASTTMPSGSSTQARPRRPPPGGPRPATASPCRAPRSDLVDRPGPLGDDAARSPPGPRGEPLEDALALVDHAAGRRPVVAAVAAPVLHEQDPPRLAQGARHAPTTQSRMPPSSRDGVTGASDTAPGRRRRRGPRSDPRAPRVPRGDPHRRGRRAGHRRRGRPDREVPGLHLGRPVPVMALVSGRNRLDEDRWPPRGRRRRRAGRRRRRAGRPATPSGVCRPSGTPPSSDGHRRGPARLHEVWAAAGTPRDVFVVP